MNYTEYDADAPSVDWQESQDEAVSCAQIERDEDEAYTVLNSMTGCADDLDTYAASQADLADAIATAAKEAGQ